MAAPAKAGGSHQNIMLIMWEPLIMQELLISIMQEPKSGRSWTSKVFNTVITLDTYQFLTTIADPWYFWKGICLSKAHKPVTLSGNATFTKV